MIEIPVSIGEVIDKITILQIKKDRIADITKKRNVIKELELLQNKIHIDVSNDLISELKNVNEQLWDIEDQIRIYEKNQDFGLEFINLARSVYITNDKRAELKKQINLETRSELIEEKSYE